MKRDEVLKNCRTHTFDLVVIGGGITGAGLVRDASLRGLDCLLLERGDFSSGTSSKSGKLIHGGLRYLKSFQIPLVLESVRERNLLLKIIAPHIVRPVRFFLPFYRKSKTPRWLAAVGLFLYDFLALFSNAENFRIIGASKVPSEEPHLLEAENGALTYMDCACMDTRLTIDTLKSAVTSGAKLINYCEVKGLAFEEEGIKLECADKLSGLTEVIRSKTVINATGAWADRLLERSPSAGRFGVQATSGIHLIFSRTKLPIKNTLALEHPEDFRNIYLVPWEESVLVGTTDRFCKVGELELAVDEASTSYLVRALNHYFPKLDLCEKDVRSTFIGVRPLVGAEANQKEGQIPRDFAILEDKHGLLSITGGKLTTYRAMAKKTIDRLVALYFPKHPLKPCSTKAPIAGGDLSKITAAHKERLKSFPSFELILKRYGDECLTLLKICEENPTRAQFISPGLPYTWAELDYFIEHEFVQRLCDVVFRRTDMGLFYPEALETYLPVMAAHIGSTLGWDERKQAQEVESVRSLLRGAR